MGPFRRVPMTLGSDRGKDNWEATSRMTQSTTHYALSYSKGVPH